jgi:hypothetical protein
MDARSWVVGGAIVAAAAFRVGGAFAMRDGALTEETAGTAADDAAAMDAGDAAAAAMVPAGYIAARSRSFNIAACMEGGNGVAVRTQPFRIK